ncbi:MULTISPECIES: hypothetical protein [Bacillus cereus group]|uniref:hypothetical protein n=1 Tax=Bacillus cereus group TaxID=86661 RepID=UPI0020D26A54|nr:hypothetical protein [Bacillus wiedmannii]
MLVSLAEGNMKHIITKIAYLLNKYPSTRSSDIMLQLKYWRELVLLEYMYDVEK